MKLSLRLFALLAVVSLSAVVVVPAEASPIDGTKLMADTLGSGIQITYTVNLREREETMIMVRGDGRSDLDCFVYDENGHMVAKDNDATDMCIISVKPQWTGRFRIVISNVGSTQDTFTGQVL